MPPQWGKGIYMNEIYGIDPAKPDSERTAMVLVEPSRLTSPIPQSVIDTYKSIVAQGFIVLETQQRVCIESDPKVKGQIGWVILVQPKESYREPWRVWVFDHDPLSEVEAIAVDVEIA